MAARESLRYDGKSFEQWSTEWRTELKTERQAEAIEAFAKFGRRGFGKEATQEILELMREYSIFVIADNPPGRLKEAALQAFSRRDPHSGEAIEPIPPEQAVPVLIGELKTGNKNSRCFALRVLGLMGPDARTAIPALWDLWETTQDAETRPLIVEAIAGADPTGEQIVLLLKKLMASNDAQRFGVAVTALTQIYFDHPGSLVNLPGDDYRLTAKGIVVLPLILEGIEQNNAAIRLTAIEMLGQLAPAAESALPALLRTFVKGNADDRKAVAVGIRRAGHSTRLVRQIKQTTDVKEQAAIVALLGSTVENFQVAAPAIKDIPKDTWPAKSSAGRMRNTDRKRLTGQGR